MLRHLLVISFVLAMIAGSGVSAPAGAVETVRFRSASSPPTPFRQRLAQERGETAVTQPGDEISGNLYRPERPGRLPALVVLHGCSGASSPEVQAYTADWLTSLGYVALLVDSFGPRGINNECAGGTTDRTMDALGALDYLASLPFVQSDRIAVVGYSQGGGTALFGVNVEAPQLASNNHFAAAVAYYPNCASADVTASALVLIGELDDWTPASRCRSMMARRSPSMIDVRLVVYPGTYHSFNARRLAGKPSSYFGHHLEYNEAADLAARREVEAFLAAALGK